MFWVKLSLNIDWNIRIVVNNSNKEWIVYFGINYVYFLGKTLLKSGQAIRYIFFSIAFGNAKKGCRCCPFCGIEVFRGFYLLRRYLIKYKNLLWMKLYQLFIYSFVKNNPIKLVQLNMKGYMSVRTFLSKYFNYRWF